MPDKKIEAIHNFVIGLAELRQKVKDDARLMVDNLPADILLDEEALAAFMEEMAVVLSRKYLINDSGRIVAEPAKLIKDYVRAMAVKK